MTYIDSLTSLLSFVGFTDSRISLLNVIAIEFEDYDGRIDIFGWPRGNRGPA